jgi:acetolactate synthase small subunit
MDATAAEFHPEIMKDSDKNLEQLQKQLEALHQNLRTVRHAINNHVAVLMAMAELSQIPPSARSSASFAWKRPRKLPRPSVDSQSCSMAR